MPGRFAGTIPLRAAQATPKTHEWIPTPIRGAEMHAPLFDSPVGASGQFDRSGEALFHTQTQARSQFPGRPRKVARLVAQMGLPRCAPRGRWHRPIDFRGEVNGFSSDAVKSIGSLCVAPGRTTAQRRHSFPSDSTPPATVIGGGGVDL